MTWADRVSVLLAAGAIVATLGIGTCSTNARFGDFNGRIGDTNRRIDDQNRRMDERFDAVDRRIDERFEDVNRRMEERFEGVNRRIDDLQREIRDLRAIVIDAIERGQESAQ